MLLASLAKVCLAKDYSPNPGKPLYQQRTVTLPCKLLVTRNRVQTLTLTSNQEVTSVTPKSTQF